MLLSKNSVSRLFAVLVLSTLLFSCSARKNTSGKTRTTAAAEATASATTAAAGTTITSGSQKQTKAAQNYSTYSADVTAYIQKYSVYAVKEMKDFGVPASIILAQGIHESGAGKSLLAQEANNHFGVKCNSDWTGPTYRMNDDAPNECFRKYSNAEESFDDHMKFLQRKRYSSLFLLDKMDYKGWATGLKRCGYATNPRYAEILISMIERYDLTRFDQGVTPVADASYLARHNTDPKPTEASVTENTHQPVLEGSAAAATMLKAAGSSRKGSTVIMDTIHQKVYIMDTIYQYSYQNASDKARKSAASSGSDATESSVRPVVTPSSSTDAADSASSNTAPKRLPSLLLDNSAGSTDKAAGADKPADAAGSQTVTPAASVPVTTAAGQATPAQSTAAVNTAPAAASTPAASAPSATAAASPADDSDQSLPLTYTVVQHDTLYGIARRFKLTMDDLQKLNNLPDTKVKIDQVLKLR